jgi:predicted peptidase
VHIKQEVLEPGGQRYAIAFPEKFSAREPVPLILALHYAGHGTDYYGRTILEQLIQPALHDLGAIIVAPDCPAKSWCDPHSEKFILDLLDSVSIRYPVDSGRVLVTGYSMGGNGAWCLAARYPDRFCAAVVISGWPPEELDLVAWRVPIYIIHSRDDEFISIEPTQITAKKLAEIGRVIEFDILEGITHFEVYRFTQPLKATVSWIEAVWNK